jgi:hypothetical protein
VVVLLLATFSPNTFADTNAAKEEMRSANAKLENSNSKKKSPKTPNRFSHISDPNASSSDLLHSRSTLSEKWDHLLPSTEATSKSMAPSSASKAPHTAQ